MRKILCSACLLGVDCKYDGGNNANKNILGLAQKEILISIRPEQLGGLPTPRSRACRMGDKVIDELGNDKTEAFARGAQETLKIAKELNVGEAILKQRSPSCGNGKIYADFDGKIIDGDGVTAELLKKNGIKVVSDDEL